MHDGLMNYRIETEVDVIDTKQWEQYVLNHQRANIFQTPQMYAVYQGTSNYQPVVIACFEKNDLKGILLAVIQREYSGLLGKLSARSIIWGGPLADSEAITEMILGRYDQEIRKHAIYSQFRNFHVLTDNEKRVFEVHGYAYDPHLNILVDLPADTDRFWRGIKRNRKDGINKASRQGFTFFTSDDPEMCGPFYKLLRESYKRIKLPYPDTDFFSILSSEASGYSKWFVLKKDELPIIVLLAMVYKETIYAFYIGTTNDSELLRLRPVDLFYYQVMCWGIENGYKRFDWMGAGKPDREYGVRKFKIQYGGDLLETGRFEKIHKPTTYKVSRFGFRIWQKFRG